MWRPGGNIMEINGFLELCMHTQCHTYRKVSAVFSLVNTLEAWKKWWQLSPQAHYIWLNLSFLHNSLYSIIHHYPPSPKVRFEEKKKKKTEERRSWRCRRRRECSLNRFPLWVILRIMAEVLNYGKIISIFFLFEQCRTLSFRKGRPDCVRLKN